MTLKVNPFLNLGASTAGYVKSGTHVLNAYPDAFIIPKTIARSSASLPQISLAHDIARGPYGTAARTIKKENHFKPFGIVHIARQMEENNPKD